MQYHWTKIWLRRTQFRRVLFTYLCAILFTWWTSCAKSRHNHWFIHYLPFDSIYVLLSYNLKFYDPCVTNENSCQFFYLDKLVSNVILDQKLTWNIFNATCLKITVKQSYTPFTTTLKQSFGIIWPNSISYVMILRK